MKNTLLKTVSVVAVMSLLLTLGVEAFGAEATLTFYAWVVSGFIGAYFANQTED